MMTVGFPTVKSLTHCQATNEIRPHLRTQASERISSNRLELWKLPARSVAAQFLHPRKAFKSSSGRAIKLEPNKDYAWHGLSRWIKT